MRSPRKSGGIDFANERETEDMLRQIASYYGYTLKELREMHQPSINPETLVWLMINLMNIMLKNYWMQKKRMNQIEDTQTQATEH